MMMDMPITDIPIRVCGIPAFARIYSVFSGERACNEIDDLPEVDFNIRDRKGYRAAWLEKKAKDAGINLEVSVLQALKDQDR